MPCQCKLLLKNKRCKFHGGKSLNAADKARITKETGRIFRKVGPNTPEGIAKVTLCLRNTPTWRKKLERERGSA